MRIQSSILLLSVISLVSAACGSKAPVGPDLTKVEPSEVTGTVWGEVLDANTNLPLEGVTVSLAIGGNSSEQSSDAAGSFSFASVPAGGQAGVTLTKDGYSRVTLMVSIPGNTGNFPTSGIGAFVGPVALFPLTGSIDVQVVGFDGLPIDAASGQATTTLAYVVAGNPEGRVSSSASSSNGMMRFTGLPSLAAITQWGGVISVAVSPVDTNGDGIIDYQGVVDSRTGAWLLTHGGRLTIELPPVGGNDILYPIASSVGSLLTGGIARAGDSVVGLNGPVRVVYNQLVDQRTLVAAIFDDEGKIEIDSNAEVRDGNIVVVTPNAPFNEGREYHIIVDVRAAGTTSTGGHSRRTGPFFSTPIVGDPQIGPNYTMTDVNGNSVLDATDTIEIRLNQVLGLGEGNTSGWFPFYFNDDLDGSGIKGDSIGEWESGMPIMAISNEPAPDAPFTFSGYTRVFLVRMPFSKFAYSISQNIAKPIIMNFSGNEGGYLHVTDPEGRPAVTPAASESLVVSF